MAKIKIATAGVLCLLAVAACSSSGSHGGDSKADNPSSATWYRNGYQFAKKSLKKGEPSDNAAAFAKSGTANQLSWCNDAYAPILVQNAPARKEYEGVTTNAPPRSKPATKASQRAYSLWLAGCLAGLSGGKE
jgi:hypothetical protein